MCFKKILYGVLSVFALPLCSCAEDNRIKEQLTDYFANLFSEPIVVRMNSQFIRDCYLFSNGDFEGYDKPIDINVSYEETPLAIDIEGKVMAVNLDLLQALPSIEEGKVRLTSDAPRYDETFPVVFDLPSYRAFLDELMLKQVGPYGGWKGETYDDHALVQRQSVTSGHFYTRWTYSFYFDSGRLSYSVLKYEHNIYGNYNESERVENYYFGTEPYYDVQEPARALKEMAEYLTLLFEYYQDSQYC